MRLSTLRTLLLRLVAAALIVGTAIGLRAAGPASADTTGWRADVLVDRLTTIGIITVAVLLLPALLLAARSRGEGPTRPRRSRPSTAIVLVVFAVTLALGLWLADRFRQPPGRSALPEVVEQAPAPAPAAPDTNDEGPPWPLISGLAVVTVAAAVLSSRRRRTEEDDEDVPDVAEPESAPTWRAGALAASDALRSRPQDPPRARVLSAYDAFEATLATQGVLRGTSGTATGLLDRAVAEGFPSADALRLTELFSAARYGDQPVTDEDVAAAERALFSVLAAT